MTQPRQAQAVITRELTRLERPRKHPIHLGYAAIVARAHALSLPQCSATDITIRDRLLIIERQPRNSRGCSTAVAACSVCPNQTSGRWITCTPLDGSTAMRCHSGGMVPNSSEQWTLIS